MSETTSTRSAPMAPPDGVAPRVIDIPVRFSDIDGMGHANNARYVTYTEEARTRWAFEDLKVRSERDMSFILAKVDIDFLAAANLGDTVRVEMWVPRIGGKSWDFAYRLTERDRGTLFATARTVQVGFDYANERTVPVPEAFLPSLKALGG